MQVGSSGLSRFGVSAGDTVVAPSEIQSGMNNVSGQINLLVDRLSSLHVALGSVMTPAGPEEDSSLKSIHSGPSTPLGHELENHNDRLRAANNSVQDILDRIKL